LALVVIAASLAVIALRLSDTTPPTQRVVVQNLVRTQCVPRTLPLGGSNNPC